MLRNEDYQHIFHEIKNIVALVNSSLQLIEKKHPEVTSFDYWNDAVTDVGALKRIVTELSPVNIGKDLNKSSVSVPQFLEEIRNATRASLDKANIHYSFHCKEELPLIEIDTFRMKEAVINLLKNAFEAMNGSGTIRVCAYQKDGCVCLDISDSGCGMDSDALKQLFTPFFTSKEHGNGLGLIITKSIIESHGGTLSCSSEPGVGTTFTISLPPLSVY